jgi:hypothetical protein
MRTRRCPYINFYAYQKPFFHYKLSQLIISVTQHLAVTHRPSSCFKMWGRYFSLFFMYVQFIKQGADKSLARPGRKQATATEDFDVRISYL